MALNIYETATPTSAFSTESSFSNPIANSFDGSLGAIVEKKYYVRNDDADRSYSVITVQPIDSGDDLVDGSSGFSWKLYAGDIQPVSAQWETITAGAAISLSNITGDTTYLPFWVRMIVPANSEVNSYQSVVLRLSYTET